MAGLGLYFQITTDTTPANLSLPPFMVITTIGALGLWSVIGALIITHHPWHPVAWLLFATFQFAAIDMFALGYVSYAANSGSLPIPGAVHIWIGWSGLPFVAFTISLMNLLFPSGTFLSPRWRVLVWVMAGALIVLLCLQTLEPGPIAIFPGLDNPYGASEAAWAVLEPFFFAVAALLTLCSFASLICLVLRMRRAEGNERQQIQWMLLPAILFWLGIPLLSLMEYDRSGLFGEIGVILHLVSLPAMVVAVAFAIFKYRLYDIDLIINRTLVYFSLTAFVIGMYIIIVGLLGSLFQTGSSLPVSLVATGFVAMIVQPLRERLQRTVNRFMYGERDEPYRVLGRLSERLEAVVASQSVLPTIVETVAEALKLPYAAIAVLNGERFVIAAEYAHNIETNGRTDPVEKLPLIYQSEIIGQLILARRARDEPFSEKDKQLLETIARQAGIVVFNLRLTQDLQRSREQLVTTREEERRRLRRDLHDGLGPALAATSFKLDAIYNVADHNPAVVKKLVTELKTQMQEALRDIRRIAYDLRPPALDELGLVGALREHIASHNQTQGLQITLEAPESLPLLSAAIEVAAYRIALEAITNISRHAGASRGIVRVLLADGLCLEITDDGCGLPASARAGVGLTSMRERAEELGGICTIDALPQGGTGVIARLPFSPKHIIGVV
jgi:signal transduction histidine kinase